MVSPTSPQRLLPQPQRETIPSRDHLIIKGGEGHASPLFITLRSMGRGGLSCIFYIRTNKLLERYNVDTNKKITHLSLCSGYEGIGLGLRSVLPNLREIAYVEREGFPIANLVAKMEEGKLDAAPVFTDVKQFPYGKFRGCVDILSGGFPCQPFSAAGKRQATEDPRHLFPYIADGIRECQPRIVFLENVQGILSCKTADGEPVLQYVLRTLEGLGYRATAGIFSAEEVGAPHQRKRVFIHGQLPHLASNPEAAQKRLAEGKSTLSRQVGSWPTATVFDTEIRPDGGRSLPKQAQPRTEQPLVWGEAEGCSGDSRGQENWATPIANDAKGSDYAGIRRVREALYLGGSSRELADSKGEDKFNCQCRGDRIQGQTERIFHHP